jgi:hypothetical protein
MIRSNIFEFRFCVPIPYIVLTHEMIYYDNYITHTSVGNYKTNLSLKIIFLWTFREVTEASRKVVIAFL